MTAVVLPTREDPVVAGAVAAIGGPPGAHARVGDRRFWTPVRVLLALTLLTSVLGFAQKLPCRDGSNWVEEYQYTRACYTDVVALYGAEGLSAGKVPYYEHPVEYPVVIGGVMQLSSVLARGASAVLPDDDRVAKAREEGKPEGISYALGLERTRYFYDITWLLVTACALVVVGTTARLAGRRPWDAALFALAPGLLLHATTNWDLVAMALAGVGLLAWARSRPLAAGVLLGLATATKLYPVLFLAPLLFLCLRAGRTRAWFQTALVTLLTAAAVTVPVYLTAPSYVERGGQQVNVLEAPLARLGSDGISALEPTTDLGGGEVAVNAVYRFFQLNKTRGADWDSLHFQLQKAHAGWLSDVDTINRLVTLGVVLVLALVGLLVWRAPRRPRLPQVLFLTVAGFLLVNKVDSPQYVLWLLPLAALANPRWRPFLAWQAAEVLVLYSRFYFFIGNDKPGQGVDVGWFFAAVLLRDLLLLVFMGYVVRDVLRPDSDPVRRDGVDDPAGGVLDGAPDRSLQHA